MSSVVGSQAAQIGVRHADDAAGLNAGKGKIGQVHRRLRVRVHGHAAGRRREAPSTTPAKPFEAWYCAESEGSGRRDYCSARQTSSHLGAGEPIHSLPSGVQHRRADHPSCSPNGASAVAPTHQAVGSRWTCNKKVLTLIKLAGAWEVQGPAPPVGLTKAGTDLQPGLHRTLSTTPPLSTILA